MRPWPCRPVVRRLGVTGNGAEGGKLEAFPGQFLQDDVDDVGNFILGRSRLQGSSTDKRPGVVSDRGHAKVLADEFDLPLAGFGTIEAIQVLGQILDAEMLCDMPQDGAWRIAYLEKVTESLKDFQVYEDTEPGQRLAGILLGELKLFRCRHVDFDEIPSAGIRFDARIRRFVDACHRGRGCKERI